MLAIQNIYEIYKQDVFGYLVSLTKNPILSEDLVSETFLGAIKSLPNFKGDSDIKTWLFSIARYKWYEHLRKEKTDLCFDDLAEYYITDEKGLDFSLIRKEQVGKVRLLLEKESNKSKEIVLMRIDGYSFFDIAKKQGISESAARVIDFRTKKKIREILKKEGISNE